MLAKVHCSAVQGIVAHPVEVEVNDGYGETLTVIVGLPDAAVRESRDRVTTALGNSGFKMPLGRTTINLATADIRKATSGKTIRRKHPVDLQRADAGARNQAALPAWR